MNKNGKGNLHERERTKKTQHRLKDANKKSTNFKEKPKKAQTDDIEKKNDLLNDEDLQEIVGGLTTVVIPLCKNCQERVAVHQMKLCASCFLKLK